MTDNIVGVSEFQKVAKENHGVTLVMEQAHEVALRHKRDTSGGVTVAKSVEGYVSTYGLLGQS